MIYKDKPKSREEAIDRIAAIFCPVILARLDEQLAAEAKSAEKDNEQEAA